MTDFNNPLWLALGEALLHSLWQGFAIFLLLRLLLFIFKNEVSAMKYSLAVIAMATIVISFSITFILCLKPPLNIESTESSTLSQTFLITVLPVNKTIESSSLISVIDLNKTIALFLPIYFIVVIILMLKTVLSYFKVRTLRSRGIIYIEEYNQRFRDLARQFNLSGKIQMHFSEIVDVPMMMGFFKPIILIPVAIINNLSTEQVEAIIIHELAHIKRNDYIVNIFQRLIETIFFFNPFVWMISNVIRTERENSCDDLVVKTRNNPLNYAEALYALENNRLNSYALALGAANNKNHLLKRIRRIMETRKTKITNGKFMLAASLIILSFISVAWLVPQDTLQNKRSIKKDKTVVAKPPVPPAPISEVVEPTVPPVPPSDPLDVVAPPPEIPVALPAAPMPPPLPPDSLKRSKQITFIDDDGNVRQYNSYNEIPEADRKEMEKEMAREMEQAKAELKRAQAEMEKIDIKKMNQEMEEAQKECKQAMKNVDQKKMCREMKEAMEEYEHAMENLNYAKLQKEQSELSTSLKNLNTLQVQKELAELNKLRDLSHKELDEMKRNIDNKAMLQAQEELKRAMMEKEIAMERERSGIKQNITLSNMNEMISKMESEKLISRKAGFVIQKRNGDLYINNEKQSDDLNEKYSKYTGEKDLEVKGKNSELKISGDHFEYNVFE